MTLDDIVSRLGAKKKGNAWLSKCPVCQRSIDLKRGADDKPVLFCHGGCKFEDIMAALRAGDPRVVATYEYVDERGQVLYQKLRYEPGFDGRPKSFVFRRRNGSGWVNRLGDVRRVLWGLQSIVSAPPEETIFVVEGEKDATLLAQLHLTATTNDDGAGKWNPTHAEHLAGHPVVVIPDNDALGESHAVDVAKSCMGQCPSIKLLKLPGLPAKGDVSDWIGAGHTVDELQELICTTPEWEPAREDSEHEPTKDNRLVTIGDRWPEFCDELARRRADGYFQPISTGLVSLDSILGGGIPRGAMTIEVASAGKGKTSYAIDLSLRTAGSGIPVLIWSLDMQEDDCLARVVSNLAGLRWNEVRRGEHVDAVRNVESRIKKLPLYVEDDQTLPSLDGVEEAIANIVSLHGQAPLLVIDYVQQLSDTTKSRDARLAADVVAKNLRIIAKSTGTAILALSQTARAKYHVGQDGKIDYDDVIGMAKESGEFENCAAVVLALLQQPVDEDAPRARPCWIVAAKNRFGENPGKVAATFDGLRGIFTEANPDAMGGELGLMARRRIRDAIIKVIEKNPGLTSKDAVADRVKGRAKDVREVLTELLAEGIVEQVKRGKPFRVIRPEGAE